MQATAVPPVQVEPYTYRVSPFPAGTDEGRLWATWIKSDGHGRWLVLHSYQATPEEYLTSAGEWTYDRDADTRHSFEDAEGLARDAVLARVVNRFTVQDAAERMGR